MSEAGAEHSGVGLPSEVSAPLARVETYLREYVGSLNGPGSLREAVGYALLGPGKRMRPLLAWHCCVAAGGEGEASLPAAAAVEMVHAFSLVHDDLPALDDDDLRRGRPTLHRHAGEAMAILAGDAMLTAAFEVIGSRSASHETASRLVLELSRATMRMIDGQVYDTLGGFDEGLDRSGRLELVHANKTGALITAACRMGAMCAPGGGDGGQRAGLEAVTRYGNAIGLMFQIVDDLLDVTQSTEHLGKRSGKDEAAGKLTYPVVHGVERSREHVRRLREEALGALEPLGGRADPLRSLCEYLAVRTR